MKKKEKREFLRRFIDSCNVHTVNTSHMISEKTHSFGKSILDQFIIDECIEKSDKEMKEEKEATRLKRGDVILDDNFPLWHATVTLSNILIGQDSRGRHMEIQKTKKSADKLLSRLSKDPDNYSLLAQTYAEDACMLAVKWLRNKKEKLDSYSH